MEITIMTKVTVDRAIREKFHNLDTLLEICDASGKTLGFFHPVVVAEARVSRTGRSPYSHEELQYLISASRQKWPFFLGNALS
jgi:hypothetical protein